MVSDWQSAKHEFNCTTQLKTPCIPSSVNVWRPLYTLMDEPIRPKGTPKHKSKSCQLGEFRGAFWPSGEAAPLVEGINILTSV